MKMLKTKHFRRIAVFLAMIAPAVYLFGSLFSGLTGSHGQQVFADTTDDGEYSFSLHFLKDKDLAYATGQPFNASNYYTSDYLPIYNGATLSISLEPVGTVNGNLQKHIFFYGADYSFISYSANNDAYLTRTFVPVSGAVYFRLACGQFPDGLSGSYIVYSPAGVPEIDASYYSDYVFGQFFARDNFLVQWGRNAISENPYGFAPFGAFWRYLDTNVLHLSNDQMGLMGYGYIYYCSHVLLFDIGFILVTFFLDFIQKVADKFTGGE